MYTGYALSASAGILDEADRDRDHGAAQGCAAGHDSTQETPAEIPTCQCTDRTHGMSLVTNTGMRIDRTHGMSIVTNTGLSTHR